MGRIVEYTLVSADGVFSNPKLTGNLAAYRDDAYYRDGLGILKASAAMLYGRKTYEMFSKTWPGRDHPWADRLTQIKKYVFSTSLREGNWGAPSWSTCSTSPFTRSFSEVVACWSAMGSRPR